MDVEEVHTESALPITIATEGRRLVRGSGGSQWRHVLLDGEARGRRVGSVRAGVRAACARVAQVGEVVPLLLATALVAIVLCPSAVALPLSLAVVTALLPPILLALGARAGLIDICAGSTLVRGDRGLRWTGTRREGRVDASEDHATDQQELEERPAGMSRAGAFNREGPR